jgi:hypothetical protein
MSKLERTSASELEGVAAFVRSRIPTFTLDREEASEDLALGNGHTNNTWRRGTNKNACRHDEGSLHVSRRSGCSSRLALALE